MDKRTKEENERLVENHLYLVLNELDKYPIDKREELLYIGLAGLSKAADINCGMVEFIDAAKFQIKSEIRKYLKEQARN
jgi:DNA-directed RNA polymerase specialized sigma subunit